MIPIIFLLEIFELKQKIKDKDSELMNSVKAVEEAEKELLEIKTNHKSLIDECTSLTRQKQALDETLESVSKQLGKYIVT